MIKKSVIIIFSVVAFSTALWFYIVNTKRDFKYFNYEKLETGDIMFVRGLSIKSSLVVLINRNTNNYSHCGVIYKEKNECFIIHSTPTPIDKREGRLVKERLKQFFISNKVTIASVYRIDNSEKQYMRRSMDILDSYLKQKILFDDDFKLNNSKLYCTELVYKIYIKSGLSIITEKDFDKVIFPCDLIKSEYLRHVLTY